MQVFGGSYGEGSNRTKISSSVSPFSSPRQQNAARSFGFSSINSPLQSSFSFTSSPSSSCTEDNNVASDVCTSAFATENHRYLARLTLEYQQLVNRYDLCVTHLKDAAKEAENLRQENTSLRIANNDLTKRLTLLTEVSLLRNRYLPSGGFPSLSIINDFRNLSVGDDGRVHRNHHVSSDVSVSDNNTSPTSVIESNRFDEKRNGERVTVPKSISVRSCGYLKANQAAGGAGSTNRPPRAASPVKTETQQQQRVFVPGGNKEQEALEFDVYDQGMFKTEICNKWQETGACPYGENCQFAHGVNELRPIIRHPRYKTEVCRMVLAGDPCPYGHRCHFRHALTEQERYMGAAA